MGIKILAAGAVLGLLFYTGVRAYQKEGSFRPGKDTKEFQENHVVFQDKGKDRNNLEDSTGDSDLWKKDKEDQPLDMSQIPDSSVLFEQNKNAQMRSNNKFLEDQTGKKTPVKITQVTNDDSKGTIKITKDDPSGDSDGSKNRPDNNKKPSGNDGEDGNRDNTPGNGTDPLPGGTAAPQPGAESPQPDTGHRPPEPTEDSPAATARPTAVPTPTVKPKPPEGTPVVPKGDSLIEGVYPNITDFPTDGVDESQHTLSLNVMPIFNIDRKEYVYYGSELTPEKLLCSVIVYVEDETGRVLYRLKEFNDNFTIGDYPAVARENFTVPFLFRQNANAPWKTTNVDFEVLPYKFFVLDQQEQLFDETAPSDGALNLLAYYTCRLTPEQRKTIRSQEEYPLNELIPGWIDTVDNVMVSDQYQATEKGWKAFRPAETVSLPEGYEAKLKWYLNLDDFNYCANLQYLQALTKIPEGVQDLEVMQGIHWVALENCELNTLTLSDSTAVVNTDSLVVKDAFKVSENNPYFTVQNDVLMDKDMTKIQGIPLSCREIDVPDTVTQITVPSVNDIQKLTFHSSEPPQINVENLQNAILWVPQASYDTYYAQWADQLADSVQLVSDGEDGGDITATDGAVLSKDGTILYRLLDTVKGNYIVPDTVRVIRKDAFQQCSELYQITVTPQVEDLEENSLVCDSLQKVVLLEDKVPLHAEGSFVASGTEVLVKKAVYSGWEEDKRPSGLKAADLKLEKKNGYFCLTEDGTRILLQAPEDLKLFEGGEEVCGRVDEIAPGAFYSCKEMIAAVPPQSVKTIDDHAFMGCDGLQGILFQSKDTLSIGNEAFGDCSHIRFVAYNTKKIHIAEGYTPLVTGFALPGAEGYTQTLMVPYTTYKLTHASEFFLEGTPEEGLYLYADYHQEGVVEGTYLAAATNNVKGKLPLRKDVAEIIFWAFKGCKEKLEIDFTQYENLFAIGEHAFEGSGLTGELTIPENINFLGLYSFAGCTDITQVNIESSYMTEIPMYVFSGCTALSSVNINADSPVTEIGRFAFSETKLTSFVVPENVKTIYDNVFSKCASLKELHMTGEKPAALKLSDDRKKFTFGEEMPEDFKIVVPGEYAAVYRKEWEQYADKIVAEADTRRR